MKPTDVPSRVGYVVSRFPKTTETFILREMQAVERHGWDVSLFSIRRESNEILQPGVETYADRLVAISDLSRQQLLAAQLRLVRRRPRVAAAMWWRAVAGNARSPKFLARALVVAWGAPALAEAATSQGVRHLHAHWGTHSALLGHLIGLVTGLPYSVTLHAHDLHVDQTMLATKLEGATRVVTISDHNADLIRAQFPRVAERTMVVHCGVEVDVLQVVEPRDETTVAPPRLVCVAGLRGFKGHRYLLEAVDLLRGRGVSVWCDLVGDGPLRAELEAMAGPDVGFHGALPVGDAMDIVRRGTVFVMPSVELADGRRDGIPVALMEAMALGVPVVSTSVSGIPELVHDGSTGVLVPPQDAAALADALESLLADAGRRAMLARYARRLIEQQFDIDHSGEIMCGIFDPPEREQKVG